jgi:hypothetical protein
VKELSLEEVLRIAGGVPLSAALDELTYRAPEETVNDPSTTRTSLALPFGRPSPPDSCATTARAPAAIPIYWRSNR